MTEYSQGELVTTAQKVFREHTGLREIYRSVGRILVEATCPFCQGTVQAYLWSLAGSGKKCSCGAVLGQRGAWR